MRNMRPKIKNVRQKRNPTRNMRQKTKKMRKKRNPMKKST